MQHNNGSKKSVLDIGRGGKKRKGSAYDTRDRLLMGFHQMPNSTAKEVAADILGWIYDRYADAPKRAHDLCKLGYIKQLDNRICKRSGKHAHAFEITEKGIDYLIKNNHMPQNKQKQSETAGTSERLSFKEMKGMLGT